MRDSTRLRRMHRSSALDTDEKNCLVRVIAIVEAHEHAMSMQAREADDTRPIAPVPDRGR